ncbi:MAG: class I SAM-dependent methyltransferase [Candidatus Sulfotelmatobacter sp.]
MPAERPIHYLTPPTPVSMGDWWFDIATADHFWIRRRFDVMRRLADNALQNSQSAAEIGCGNGLLQKGVEDHYGISITGFDLNEVALRKNVSRLSPLYCYDIHQRNPEFSARFDLLVLFDVLEHIDAEGDFLQSAKFHLSDSGILLVNVPAHQFLYSDYDRAAGHVRRYSANRLAKVAEENGFEISALSYWGLPLVPLLLARKGVSMQRTDGKAGFDTRGSTMNSLLAAVARCEPLPQKLLGTSLMAVLRRHG